MGKGAMWEEAPAKFPLKKNPTHHFFSHATEWFSYLNNRVLHSEKQVYYSIVNTTIDDIVEISLLL